MSVCINAVVEDWEIASRLADAPADLTDVLQELSARDPAKLGSKCALWKLNDNNAEIAAWLRAFADALAPVPEAESAPEGQP